jgi:hypothetical protein
MSKDGTTKQNILFFFIALMMEAVSTSETVNLYETTQCNIPEECNLQNI